MPSSLHPSLILSTLTQLEKHQASGWGHPEVSQMLQPQDEGNRLLSELPLPGSPHVLLHGWSHLFLGTAMKRC